VPVGYRAGSFTQKELHVDSDLSYKHMSPPPICMAKLANEIVEIGAGKPISIRAVDRLSN